MKKRLRRLVLIIVFGVMTGALWLLFLPVPLGWMCKAILPWVVPHDAGVTVGLEAGSLRWHWGESALRLDLTGVEVRAGAEIVGRIGAIRIEVEKGGLWQRHGLPAVVAIDEVQVCLDFRRGGAGARWLGDLVVEAAAPERARAPFVPLALPESVLPRERRPVVFRLGTLRTKVINDRGTAAWACGPITARVQRNGRELGVEVTLQLARASAAPPITLGATLPLGGTVLSARVRAPRFATEHLPLLPGAPPLPVQAELGLEGEGEFDLLRGEVRSLTGRLALTRCRVALDDLGAPIEVEGFEVRGRAAGEPLAFSVETFRLGLAGARLAVERLEGTLGPEPRVAWKLSLDDMHAARWLALLPPRIRPSWPQAAEVAALRLERADTEGEAQVARSPNGGWLARALRASGTAAIANEGEPLRLGWQATLAPDGAITVEAEAPAIVPARWAGRLGAGTPLTVLELPLGWRTTARLTAEGDFQTGSFSLRGGSGRLAAVAGVLSREVPVHALKADVEIVDGGRRWRGMHARLELDQPVFTLATGEGAWRSDGALDAAGELRLENVSGTWLEPWLPTDLWAKLEPWGLRAGDLRQATATAKGRVQAARDADGKFALTSAEVAATLGAQVQAAKLEATARAVLPPGASVAEVTVQLNEVQPSLVRFTLPAGWPAPAMFDFPIGAKLSARVAKDGRLERASAELLAGPGRLRATPWWAVDLPLQKFVARVEAAGDFGRLAVPRLEFDAGTGFRVIARDLGVELAGVRRVAGVIEVPTCDLRAQFALLPPDLRAVAHDRLKGGALGGGQIQFAAVEAPEEPGGWRIEKFLGQLALERMQVTWPGAGELAADGLELTADFPRAALRLREVEAPGFFRGAVNLDATIEVGNFPALRAGLTADLARVRLLAPELAALPLAPEPVRAEVALNTRRELSFQIEAPALLGWPLAFSGTLAQREGGGFAADLTRFRHGRSILTAQVRGEAQGRVAVTLRGALVDADELLRAVAPFLAGKSEPGKSVPGAPLHATALTFDAAFDRLEFGAGHTLRDLRARGEFFAGWPRALLIEGIEGDANRLRASLGDGVEKQPVALAIGDASALFATLTQPLRAVKLPPGDFAALAAQLGNVSTLVAGGSLDLQGELSVERRFSGRFRLGRATVLRPPRILQLLALKSEQTWRQQPLLESFAVERVAADADGVSLGGVAIVGSGLVDRLKVRSASYRFADGRIAADVEYFGLGLLVSGTRASPQVFLPDKGVLVRALGQPVEFDFERMAAEAAEKKAAEKKR